MAKKKSLGVRELTRRKRNQDWARYKYLYRKRYEEAVKQGYDMSRVPAFPHKPEGNITKRELERAKKSYRDIIDKATNPLGDSWRESHKRGYDYQAKRDEVYEAYMRDKYGDKYDEMVENQQLMDTLLPTEVVALDRAELYGDTGYEYESDSEAIITVFERDVNETYMTLIAKLEEMPESVRKKRKIHDADMAYAVFQQKIYEHYHDQEFAKRLQKAYDEGLVVTEYYMYNEERAYEFFINLNSLGVESLQQSIDDLTNKVSDYVWNDEIMDEFNQTDDYELE